ncbi:MAG: M1 family peptidase, partial [Reichenbachiella sp.]
IIADYDVNAHGSGDMYPKGANLLHTIRQVVNDDEKWRGVLRGLNQTFYHQTVTTKQIEEYISEKTGRNFQYVFDQYLRDNSLPVLEYIIQEDKVQYRWSGVVEGFDLPLKVFLNEAEIWIEPTTNWQSTSAKNPTSFKIDSNFYVSILNVMGS